MQAILPAPIASKPVHPKYVSIETTLYDLIHAMQTEVEPGDEGLITQSISRLLQSGHITFCGDPEPWDELLAEIAPGDP